RPAGNSKVQGQVSVTGAGLASRTGPEQPLPFHELWRVAASGYSHSIAGPNFQACIASRTAVASGAGTSPGAMHSDASTSCTLRSDPSSPTTTDAHTVAANGLGGWKSSGNSGESLAMTCGNTKASWSASA